MSFFTNKNKVIDESKQIKIKESDLQMSPQFKSKKYEEKLKLFKFYKAANFYEDNIGRVEIV